MAIKWRFQEHCIPTFAFLFELMHRHACAASESLVFHMLIGQLHSESVNVENWLCPADVCASRTDSARGGNAAWRAAASVAPIIQMWSIASCSKFAGGTNFVAMSTSNTLLEPATPEVPHHLPKHFADLNFAAFCEWLPSARVQLNQLDSDEKYRTWIQEQTADIEKQPGTMPLWQVTSKLDAAAGYREVNLSALKERARTLLLDGSWSAKEEDQLMLRLATGDANASGVHL
jgi:hypothetical protein